MKKYKIGLAILAVFTIVLAIYVVSIGAKSKQDKKTYEKAQDIAQQLNKYVSNNQKIPESLEDVGAKDVPSSIHYMKVSSAEYKFCATYSSDYGYGGYNYTMPLSSTSVVEDAARDSNESADYYSSYTPSSLYIYGYKKGENCQNVKPYFRTTYTPNSSYYCSTETLRKLYASYCALYDDKTTEEDSSNQDSLQLN